ncbi:hypothetical protein [Klebsiella variicola]
MLSSSCFLFLLALFPSV